MYSYVCLWVPVARSACGNSVTNISRNFFIRQDFRHTMIIHGPKPSSCRKSWPQPAHSKLVSSPTHLPPNPTQPMRSRLLSRFEAISRRLPRISSTSAVTRSVFLSAESSSHLNYTNGFVIKNPAQFRGLRHFQTESDYHSIADEMLEDIQDAVEEALEDKGVPEFEVTYASGVLTMTMPPHGTWVLNKQTPNRQIWWSSPISGPRRYEYEDGEWVFTRDEAHSMTLGHALQEELRAIYEVELDL